MAERQVDFAAVKERVRVEDAIRVLGLTMKQESAGQFRGPCPACKDNARSLAINTGKQGFYCHSVRKGGDVIALTAHVKGVRQRDAAIFLDDHFGSDEKPSQPAQERHSDAMEPLSDLDATHELVEVLGLSEAVMEAMGGGYSKRGTMAGRLLIPLRLPSGKLIGYCGIATREDQAPLLLFPRNLEERVKTEPEKVPADQLRRLLRVVG